MPIAFGGSILRFNGSWLDRPRDVIPPWTLRLQFTEGVTPTVTKGTLVQRTSSPNVWDWTYSNGDWSRALLSQGELLSVVGAGDVSGVVNMVLLFGLCTKLETCASMNTTSLKYVGNCFDGCTSLVAAPVMSFDSIEQAYWMYSGCTALTYVPDLDLRGAAGMAKIMDNMFNGCTALVHVPMLTVDTSAYENDMRGMFSGCTGVESGALALYNYLSTIPNVKYHETYSGRYRNCIFTDCGSGTAAGLAELQQIPAAWGGLA